MKTKLFLSIFLYCIGMICGQNGDTESTDGFYSSNWLIYLYEETPSYRSTRVIPLYSYTRYPNRMKDQFSLWPLLVGYEVSKNPVPTIFPYAVEHQWYSVPFLTAGSLSVSQEEDVETSTMVSFLLMSYFQEQVVEDKYFVRDWYSLPLLSYYHSEILWEGNVEIHSTSWGNPFFSIQDTHIIQRRQVFPIYDWSIEPASLLLGEDSLKILRHARWGRDHIMQMFALDSFSLFSFSTTFSLYPGAHYHRFLYYETGREDGVTNLMKTSVAFPKTRIAIFSPWIVVESSPAGYFSWQLLPLFYYKSEGAASHFYLLPLCLEFGTDGVRFAPQPKLFPLVYYDDMYGSWDILWPLFHYVDNPAIPEECFTVRFLVDYRRRSDDAERTSTDFSLLERLLLSYQADPSSTQLELLPAGILFGYYRNQDAYQWRILGCGYLETSRKAYLQLFFLKILWGDAS